MLKEKWADIPNYEGEYHSVADAGRAIGIKASNIGEVCRGKRAKCGGFSWKYYKEAEEDEK